MLTHPVRIILLLIFTFHLFSNAAAQSTDFNNYFPLRCEGTPPADFLKPSYEKYYSDISDIRKNKSASKKDKKLQKELSFITNYKIDDILMSGRVLYGDKVSTYINTVADKLLENEPALKKKMRFYLLNVPYANALSTNNGIIFVTTGLMAQLENEAQLAFVLSHEISHFKLNHSFESFKKSKDILKGKKYDDLGSDEKVLKILKYSKENEAEADAEGLEMFAAAGYDENESVKMMDILLYSYLPFDDIVFPKTYFNDSFYKLPDNYMPDTAREITAEEDEDDEESSHPNTEFRKLNLEKYIEDGAKGELYYFGKDQFLEILKICRYEMGYLLLVKGSYTKSFYHAFLLKSIYGESCYANELIAASLYGINKNKLATEDEDGEMDDKSKEFEGQISRIASLFNSMKKDEFNILAAKTIHGIYRKYPTKYNNQINSDVFIDLLYSHKYMKSSFSKDEKGQDKTVAEVTADTLKSDEENPAKETNSKVRKIKKKKKALEVTTNSKYYRNAFIANYKMNGFGLFIDSVETIVDELKKKEEGYGLSELRKEPERRYRQSIQDERKLQKRNGKRLGIDSIIMLSPSYSAVFYGNDEPRVNSLNDELKAIEITKYLESNAAAQNLSLDLIDINRRASLNADKFNEYVLISNWMTEKYKHTDKNDILFTQKYTDEMIAQTGYHYIGFTGFSYENYRHEVSGSAWFLSTIWVFPLAFTIPYAIVHQKDLDYYYIVYDLKTGEQKLVIIDKIARGPKTQVVNIQMAYSIFQTKTKAKTK